MKMDSLKTFMLFLSCWHHPEKSQWLILERVINLHTVNL